MSITLDDVRGAARRLGSRIHRTPVIACQSFDDASGHQVFFKCENLQRAGAFKIRGALNKLAALTPAERARGVIAFSSGNHAQGVALAARMVGTTAIVCMPKDAPALKLEATRHYGAEVIFYDRMVDDREQLVREVVERTGRIVVPPFDDVAIMAGQGTAALELLEDVPSLDALLAPIGGGGLLAGCSTVARTLFPGMQVFGVEPDTANDTYLSMAGGQRVAIAPPSTIADGLRAVTPGALTFPVLRANATYEAGYLLGTSFARPLIAKGQVAVARAEEADAVAHGATGKGNDQVRFELTYAALAPDLRIVAPWRDWDLRSRTDLMAYAERHGIPVPTTPARPYSMDRNLFHISYEGGVLEDPWAEPPDKMFLLTRSPEEAPDVPTAVEIEFESGNPVAVDGQRLGPVALLERLNRLGGENGVGRIDLVENRYVGMKSRGVYETPGGTILHAAHRALESITMDRELLHLRDSLVPRYAEMVYYGFWYAPEREALQVLMDHAQRDVTGTVRLKLYKGNVTVAGRRSPLSLYRQDVVTFEADSVYRQKDAEGFIRLNALRLRIRALRDQDRPAGRP
jgi:argininosuccinate synthase